MKTCFLRHIPAAAIGAIVLCLEVTSASPSQATTLTGFSTYGGDMAGMQVTLSLLDGSSQTAIWRATDKNKIGGGAFANGWSLTQYGDTYGGYYEEYDNSWKFNYSGSSLVKSLIINAIPGNTLFDRYQGIEYTPGSADGWDFQRISGQKPNSVDYLIIPDIKNYQNDLFGALKLTWNNGFRGSLAFLADTDSGTTFDPVKPKDPQATLSLLPTPAPSPTPAPAPSPAPSPAPPPNTPPTLNFSDYTINEGQSASVTLSGTDPDSDPITFTLNGQTIADSKTSGTRSGTFNLGTYADNGSFSLTGKAVDSRGGQSNTVTKTLTVLNVAPTLSSFALNGNNSDITIDEGQSVSAALSATDPGLYDDITFFVNGSNIGTDSTRTTGARTITTNLGTFNDDTVVTYTAVARDKDNAYSNTVTRTVTVRNVPPTLTAFNLSSETIDQGQYASGNLSATDPGADPITFLINGNSVGTDPSTSGTRSQSTNLGLFKKPGTYTFKAQAKDDDGGFSNIVEKTLTVKNLPPTITSLIAPLIVQSGHLFDFAATATDPGDDILTYGWDFGNSGLFKDFTGSSGQWSFDRDGIYKVGLRVSDGYGGFAYRYFQIESVPEPSSTLGMLALGALGVGSLLKRRQQQKV